MATSSTFSRGPFARETLLQEVSAAHPLSWGILLIILGFLAIVFPSVTSLSITLILGAILALSGVIQLVHAIQRRHHKGLRSRLVLSIATLAAGALILSNPFVATVSLAYILVGFMMASAILKMTFAFEMGKTKGRNWLIFSALLSLILGLVMLSLMPMAAFILPALFYGVDMIFFGFALTALNASHASPAKPRTAL